MLNYEYCTISSNPDNGILNFQHDNENTAWPILWMKKKNQRKMSLSVSHYLRMQWFFFISCHFFEWHLIFSLIILSLTPFLFILVLFCSWCTHWMISLPFSHQLYRTYALNEHYFTFHNWTFSHALWNQI